MSKLFDTLEKIRKNEEAMSKKSSSAVVEERGAKGKSRHKNLILNKNIILIIFAATVCGGGIYIFLPSIYPIIANNSNQTKIASTPADTHEQPIKDVKQNIPPPEVQNEQAASEVKEPDNSGAENVTENRLPAENNLTEESKFLELNNLGVQLVSKKDYLQGIYYFQKALELKPDSIEPIINAAVAYTELGLQEKALEFFIKAYEIDPANLDLIENLEILKNTGFMGQAELADKFPEIILPALDSVDGQPKSGK